MNPYDIAGPGSHHQPKEIPMTANKAIAAAILAGLVALLAEFRDKAPVTPMDWVVALLAALVAGLAVYVIPNKP